MITWQGVRNLFRRNRNRTCEEREMEEGITFDELMEIVEARTDEENQAIIDSIHDYDAIDAMEREDGQ